MSCLIMERLKLNNFKLLNSNQNAKKETSAERNIFESIFISKTPVYRNLYTIFQKSQS